MIFPADYSLAELRRMEPAYQGTARAWEGTLKLDGAVVWECGHRHFNREMPSRTRPAAVSCAAKAKVEACMEAGRR